MQHLSFEVLEGKECTDAATAINRIAQHHPLDQLLDPAPLRKFWVFVNPTSGTGKAMEVWEKARTLFERSGIESELVGE